MGATGAARKALIFTESRRTQEYLKAFLESHGYQESRRLQRDEWRAGRRRDLRTLGEENRGPAALGSRAVDVRTALIDTSG